MATGAFAFKVETDVPPSYFGKLFDFIYAQYLNPQKQRYINLVRQTSPTTQKLSYTIVDLQGRYLIDVVIFANTQNINATVTPLDPELPSQAIDEAKQDLTIVTKMFEEKARKATWYFAWREGEQIVPEKVKEKEKSFRRLFLETQILFFVVFIVLGMGLFIVVFTYYPDWFWIAPLALIGSQFILVFYSNRIIARTGDWTITEKNPIIHFLEYHLPVGTLGTLDDLKATSPQQLAAIKREVYEEILSKHGEIDCAQAEKVFNKHNVSCSEGTLSAKKVNVYALVKKVADKFGYKVPKIVVSNTMTPNAAASGPSPSRGIVLITTGALAQLDEPELISVLGHEFGHLKGRDPLILYGLTSAEFLFRFYVLFVFVPYIFVSFLFFVYFWAIMTVIFFIAKFFEARADLTSAIMIGQPKIMARALEKIGFQRLLFERTPSFRLQEWIGMDSHPPIYWRVARMENLEEPVKVRYPLIRSIKEVFKGFAETL
jgi:heat shock protein HtpX